MKTKPLPPHLSQVPIGRPIRSGAGRMKYCASCRRSIDGRHKLAQKHVQQHRYPLQVSREKLKPANCCGRPMWYRSWASGMSARRLMPHGWIITTQCNARSGFQSQHLLPGSGAEQSRVELRWNPRASSPVSSLGFWFRSVRRARDAQGERRERRERDGNFLASFLCPHCYRCKYCIFTELLYLRGKCTVTGRLGLGWLGPSANLAGALGPCHVAFT